MRPPGRPASAELSVERQHVGLVVGFLVGSGALWALRAFRAAEPPPVAEPPASTAPAIPRPGPSPKADPSYAGSLDLFVETNRAAAKGITDTGESVPRVREGAVVKPIPGVPAEEAEPSPAASPAPSRPGPEAAPLPDDPQIGALGLLRIVGLGACLLALLATPLPAGGRVASRALVACGGAASFATLLLALGARLKGEGPETLVWLGASVFLVALSAGRLTRQA